MSRRLVLTVLMCAVVVGASAVPAFAGPIPASVGRRLFFDTNLSNPPGQSCASCHTARTGFADPDSGLPVSEGAVRGRFGDRSAPSAAYASFNPPLSYDTTLGTYVGGQFWDGRSASLEEQAKGPFLNPLEMHMANKRAVVARVALSPYAHDFRVVFGIDSLSLKNPDAAYENIAFAIAEYERTVDLNQFTAKHDYAMMRTGPARMAVFTMQERQGMLLFNGKAKCNVCHTTAMVEGADPMMIMPTEPVLFTDFRYANLGIPKNWDNPYLTMPKSLNPAGLGYIDHGLARALPGGLRRNPGFDGMFKTPTLRNIALTAPYGHNGYFATLKDIVHFYNTRDVPSAGWPAPEVAANIDTVNMGNLGLTPMEEDAIVAFLGTLSDHWNGQ